MRTVESGPLDAVSLRRAVLDTALAMNRSGLSPGRSGNVSCRLDDGMLITPSGMAYDAIGPDDIVHVDRSGGLAAGQRRPSSEWRFHLSAYAARPDIGAVVHTHSLNATVLACAHRPIPAFHYMVAVAGGADIPLVPYAMFGTDALSRHVAKGLADRNACLLANHGLVAVGPTLAAALELAAEVETLASQYVQVLQLGATVVLPDEEMARVAAAFRTYGQNGQT